MKSRKPLSTKIPPKAGEDYQLIQDWIADARPAVTPLLEALDELIRQQLPDPRYAIKWSSAFYGSPSLGWCIELTAYNVSVNIVFLNGSRLSTPPELGDETRYVKLKNLSELDSPQLHEWIKESCGMPGWAW